MMLNSGALERRRITNFLSSRHPTTNPMYTGQGIVRVYGKITLASGVVLAQHNILNGNFRTERFKSYSFVPFPRGDTLKNNGNIDFTWELTGNERNIYLQGVVGDYPNAYIFNGYIDIMR